ncbi:MAG: hypothetical protein M1830_004495 [Pleopsidium flavum]|nr:MAG: hypothetical protein M1830_004495 [Pleopsidium flavum]
MSLKQEIETWVQALAHYDNNEFEEALRAFDGIPDTSKILFNCGVIHATLGEHDKAVECYQRAVRLDQYLAVAYFQQGVSNFLVGDFEEALANFNDTLLYLRGNTYIDYEQLGLKFRLFSCEVLFNRGLCYIYLQQKDGGLQDFAFALKEKVTPDHDVIDEAIREEAEGYTVFSIPVGVVYRPNSAKVKNLKTKDYLGKARLVAASDKSNTFTGFAGSEAKKNMFRDDIGRDDRLPDSFAFAASNLVKPGKQNRGRQQSEPPINRNMFPPTPPPEGDKLASFAGSNGSGAGPPGMTGRAASVRSVKSRPEKLDLAKPALEKEKPRLGTMRTASEPRGPTRNFSHSRMRDPPSRDRLFGETTNRRGHGDDGYPEELYHPHRSPRSSNGVRRTGSRSRRPEYIDEEDEALSSAYDRSSIDEPDFEIVGGGTAPPPRQRRGASSKKPEIRSIRVKVHADDTRYIMISATLDFAQFIERIREKFAIRGRFKCKIRDDGDMITMGDQDDLDMAVATCKLEARRERAEMGKMEVSLALL